MPVSNPRIYMDNHSTTRVDPRVFEAMRPYFSEKYGNAASVNHAFGCEAREAVEAARVQVAGLLNVAANSVIFTSGATESNNIALKGVMRGAAGKTKGHLIVNAAEHPSVLDPARRLQRAGFEVTILPVDSYGMVDPQSVAAAIRPSTALVSVMWANNEVGTLNPIADISTICRDRGVLLHCDAVQAVGKIAIDLERLPVDLLSLTAHKLYGPKGIGALCIRRGEPRIPIDPLFDGGGHENNLRSGTLPVELIAGFAECCRLAGECWQSEATALAGLRDRMWQDLQSTVPDIHSNGHPTQRLAGNLNVSIDGVDGEALMMSLKGLAVSSGSACTSATPAPSHVLRAMGISEALTRASLRFGLGRFNTADDVDHAVKMVAAAVQRLRE